MQEIVVINAIIYMYILAIAKMTYYTAKGDIFN